MLVHTEEKEKLKEEIIQGIEYLDVTWLNKINNLINTIKIKES